MKIEYKHKLNKEESYQRIDNLLDELQKQYSDDIRNPQKSWNSTQDKMDFSVEIKGFEIKGNVQLKDKNLVLEGKLPFLASMFSGKIKNTITEKLDEIMS